MTTFRRAVSAVAIALWLNVATADEPARSGYDYIKPATRAMQDDEFENPGLLTVDYGQELFVHRHAASKQSCADCHGEAGERFDSRAIARYPVYDSATKQIITLQHRISNCRENIAGQRLEPDHPELVAVETFVRHRARGEAVAVQTDAPVSELLAQGEQLYKTLYGLIDMSCYHCHTLYPGQMIRGQKISQGQGNGFPAYRLDSGEITSLRQRIQQCMSLLRAEPFATDSDEIKLLEFYIMSRSNGLAIETPAVRY
jgi:sulfur-oxidizing protein SoxA